VTRPLSDTDRAALFADIRRQLAGLQRDLRDLVQTAYEAQVVDSAHVASGRADPAGEQATASVNERDGRTTPRGHMRGQIVGAESALCTILLTLENQRGWIRQVHAKAEQRHGVFDPVLNPVSADIDDVYAAADAQDRRRERGDVLTGDDAETRDRVGEKPLAQVLEGAKRGNKR